MKYHKVNKNFIPSGPLVNPQDCRIILMSYTSAKSGTFENGKKLKLSTTNERFFCGIVAIKVTEVRGPTSRKCPFNDCAECRSARSVFWQNE